MARTIATDISTALGSDGIYFIDLVEWDLGSKKLQHGKITLYQLGN